MSGRLVPCKKGLLVTASFFYFVLAWQHANAGSFELHEQNTTYLGNAYAGTASTCEDASTTYFNPAGLSVLKHSQLVASAIYYHGRIKLYDASARNAGGVVSGSSTDHPRSNAVIPSVFTNARINKNWYVGLGVLAPFGLNTRYSGTSIARYLATKSSIATVDITPSIAYKFNEKFSLGVGFDAMYVHAILNAQTFLGSQGHLYNTARGWGYGFHVGALFSPTANTSMGLAYFSVFTPTVKGTTSTLNVPTPPVSVRATINLPDRIVYSITQRYSPKWSAVGDIEWTHWSRLSELRLLYNTGSVTTFKLQNKNSWRVSLGANYVLSDYWTIKGGIAYDQSPVQTQYRIVNLPDSDKYWLAFGLKYKIHRNLAIDAAYAHLFFKQCSINEVTTLGRSIIGNYKNYADLIGVQLTWSFV